MPERNMKKQNKKVKNNLRKEKGAVFLAGTARVIGEGVLRQGRSESCTVRLQEAPRPGLLQFPLHI